MGGVKLEMWSVLVFACVDWIAWVVIYLRRLWVNQCRYLKKVITAQRSSNNKRYETVDGRNPAPVWGWQFIPLFTRVLYIPGGCLGFLHQQDEHEIHTLSTCYDLFETLKRLTFPRSEGDEYWNTELTFRNFKNNTGISSRLVVICRHAASFYLGITRSQRKPEWFPKVQPFKFPFKIDPWLVLLTLILNPFLTNLAPVQRVPSSSTIERLIQILSKKSMRLLI